MSKYGPGDEVTVMPPYDNDPYVLTFQRHARVVRVVPGHLYFVRVSSVNPQREFGPFPEARLAPGWH